MINHFLSLLDFVKRMNLSVSFADSSPKGEPFDPPSPVYIRFPPKVSATEREIALLKYQGIPTLASVGKDSAP